MDDLLTDLIGSLGFPIVVVLLFVTDRLVSGSQHKRLQAENDRKTLLLEESVIPLAARSAELLAQSEQRIRDLEEERRHAEREAARLLARQELLDDATDTERRER